MRGPTRSSDKPGCRNPSAPRPPPRGAARSRDAPVDGIGHLHNTRMALARKCIKPGGEYDNPVALQYAEARNGAFRGGGAGNSASRNPPFVFSVTIRPQVEVRPPSVTPTSAGVARGERGGRRRVAGTPVCTALGRSGTRCALSQFAESCHGREPTSSTIC